MFHHFIFQRFSPFGPFSLSSRTFRASARHASPPVPHAPPVPQLRRRTLQLLDSWASRRSMMRQVWVESSVGMTGPALEEEV